MLKVAYAKLSGCGWRAGANGTTEALDLNCPPPRVSLSLSLPIPRFALRLRFHAPPDNNPTPTLAFPATMVSERRGDWHRPHHSTPRTTLFQRSTFIHCSRKPTSLFVYLTTPFAKQHFIDSCLRPHLRLANTSSLRSLGALLQYYAARICNQAPLAMCLSLRADPMQRLR